MPHGKSYISWLQARIAELRRERRRGQWRRYSASVKGRARQDRYENTVNGSCKRFKRATRYHSARATDALAYFSVLLASSPTEVA